MPLQIAWMREIKNEWNFLYKALGV